MPIVTEGTVVTVVTVVTLATGVPIVTEVTVVTVVPVFTKETVGTVPTVVTVVPVVTEGTLLTVVTGVTLVTILTVVTVLTELTLTYRSDGSESSVCCDTGSSFFKWLQGGGYRVGKDKMDDKVQDRTKIKNLDEIGNIISPGLSKILYFGHP